MSDKPWFIDEARRWICTYDQQAFHSEDELQEHFRREHDIQGRVMFVASRDTVRCGSCRAVFASIPAVLAHIDHDHDGNTG